MFCVSNSLAGKYDNDAIAGWSNCFALYLAGNDYGSRWQVTDIIRIIVLKLFCVSNLQAETIGGEVA